MLVKDLMAWPVITVLDSATIGEALEILQRNNIRHLPVVDLNQTMVGVVSETDLIKVFPTGKQLSSFETNLLSRTPVSKVMQSNVISSSPDEPIEVAALVMRTNRISCLPVLDKKGKIIGLVTKNGIIDAFITALGIGSEGIRITILYKKKWGFLSELIAFADKHNIYIDNIVTFDRELVFKIKGKDSEFINDLKKAGYTITDVTNIKPPSLPSASGEGCC